MKIKRIIAMLAAAALCLTACSDTRVTSGAASDPFADESAASSEGTELSDEDYEELFGKYQSGIADFSDRSFEYKDGVIEKSFTARTKDNEYDVEYGYMAYINGVPQKISLNGGEPQEMVSVTLPPNTEQKITLDIKPALTEDIKSEKELQVKFLSIFNPSYKPQGQYVGFGNAHNGTADGKQIIQPDGSEESFTDIKTTTEYESVAITKEVKKKYSLGDVNASGYIMISGDYLPLKSGESSAKAEILMLGNTANAYRVFLYKNHERIQINGCDCAEMKVENGKLGILSVEIPDVQNRDILYAVAIPIDDAENAINLCKAGSTLILSEDDPSYNLVQETDETESVPSTETSDEPEEEEEEEEETGGSIYDYGIIGYIDKEQKHLLMQRRLPTDGGPSMYEFAVYDTDSKKITSTLENDYDDYCYYDDYISISSFNDPQSETTFALYDSSLNKIKMIEGDVWELPLYLDDEDIFIGMYREKTADKESVFKLARYDKDGKLIDFIKDCDTYVPASIVAVNDKLICESQHSEYGKGEFVEVMNYDGSDYRRWQIFDSTEYHYVGQLGKYIYFLPNLIKNPKDGPGKVYFYDTEKDDLIYVDTVTEEEAGSSSVTPDGKYLVTCYVEEKDRIAQQEFVRFYDIEKNELVYTYNRGKDKIEFGLAGITAYFDGVWVYSRDGNYFLKYEDLGLY